MRKDISATFNSIYFGWCRVNKDENVHNYEVRGEKKIKGEVREREKEERERENR